jgi:hypothetical protein
MISFIPGGQMLKSSSWPPAFLLREEDITQHPFGFITIVS